MLKIFEAVADDSHLVVPQMTITSIKLNQLANRGMIKTNGQKSHLLKPVITGQVALPEKYKSMFPVTKDGKVDTQEMAERAKEAKEEIKEKRIAAKELDRIKPKQVLTLEVAEKIKLTKEQSLELYKITGYKTFKGVFKKVKNILNSKIPKVKNAFFLENVRFALNKIVATDQPLRDLQKLYSRTALTQLTPMGDSSLNSADLYMRNLADGDNVPGLGEIKEVYTMPNGQKQYKINNQWYHENIVHNL